MINQSGLLQASNLQTASSLQSSALQQQPQQTPVNSNQTTAIATPYGLSQHLLHSSQTATNGSTQTNSVTSLIPTSQIQQNSQGPLIFPILQNLNEDVSLN